MNNDQVSTGIWFGIGVLIMVFAVPYELGDLQQPGTGFMPFVTGLAICLLAAIGFIAGTKAQKRGQRWKNFLKGVRWQKPLMALAGLFAYAFLLQPLGFLLATALLVGFLLKAIQPQRWPVVVSGAVLTSLVAYGVFQVWLQAQLPQGLLSF